MFCFTDDTGVGQGVGQDTISHDNQDGEECVETPTVQFCSSLLPSPLYVSSVGDRRARAVKLVNAGLAARARPGGSQPIYGGELGKGESRVVLHVDMDCFFVSVLTKDKPELKDKAVAVAHSGKAFAVMKINVRKGRGGSELGSGAGAGDAIASNT